MEKVKVLLLVVYNELMNEVFEEIGVGLIAAYLRENGYGVMLLSANEKRINYEKIVAFKPDVVGLPTFTASKASVYSVIKKIKENCNDALICLGGFFPTFYDKEILQENCDVDFIIRGEGERVFLNLANSLSSKTSLSNVKGLTYRCGDEIVRNEDEDIITDLDSMPFASRDVVRDNGLKHALISTSRACVHNCSFCISKSYWKSWRGRSPKSIVDEIKYVVENYGITSFDIVDSSFEDPDVNYDRLRGIVQGIINTGLKISYFVNMRADFVRKATPELMILLKKSGLCGVFIGIETNNEADIKIYNKTASMEENIKAIKLFRNYNIGVSIGFINFNPYSTFEGLYKNIDFLEEYNYARIFKIIEHRFIAYNKHTSLYNKLENDGLLVDSGNPCNLAYTFVDQRVKNVSDFILSYFVKARKENPSNYSSLDFYNNIYINALSHYMRLFDEEPHKKALNVVIEHDKNIRQILSTLNKVNADWFRKVLYLGENGWQLDKANEIVSEALNENFLNEIVANLNREKRLFYKKLIEIGEEYAKYI